VANDGRARAYASAEMRALSKQFLSKPNKLILRQGVCRTLEGRTFTKDRLQVAEEGYWKVLIFLSHFSLTFLSFSLSFFSGRRGGGGRDRFVVAGR